MTTQKSKQERELYYKLYQKLKRKFENEFYLWKKEIVLYYENKLKKLEKKKQEENQEK